MSKSKAAQNVKQRAEALAEEKLAGSGITMSQAKALGIEVLEPDDTLDLVGKGRAAIKFNYYDHKGQLLSAWPKHPPFWRVRLLGNPASFNAESPKYLQAPGSTVCAYLPKCQDWTILDDISSPIIITEGELKAACACLHGFPTIGLGGVHSWQSLPRGISFLPQLEAINWVGRRALIAFDSDYTTNKAVCAALWSFAQELLQHGAYPYIVSLPSVVASGKTGLDDLLVAGGPAALRTALGAAEPLGLAKPLFDYNAKYVYIKHPGIVRNLQTSINIPPEAFKGHVEATKVYHEQSLRPDGSISRKAVSAAGAWLKWPMRHAAECLTYAPGWAPEMADGSYNTWPGWGCQPKNGDAEPFRRLVAHLFQGAEPGAMDWFLQWCAYPLQHPGAKMFSSAVLYGIKHGTGKSLLGYTLGRIYGKNFTEIKQSNLHGNFNEWASERQFVLGDDITGSDKRSDADILKTLITQKEMRVNAKYMPSYTIPDTINYYFTSNQPDAFFLEDDDRRFFIQEVLADKLTDAFYAKYMAWLEGSGPAYLFDWLLKLSLKGFNPSAAAFKTAAKARMISDVKSDLGAWVQQLIEFPSQILKVGPVPLRRDIYTSKELLFFYDPLGKTGTTANGLGRELRRSGICQVCNGNPVVGLDGVQARYYAVRNMIRWRSADYKAVQDNLALDVERGMKGVRNG